MFEVDGEGNEVPISDLRSREEKAAATATKAPAKQTGKQSGKPKGGQPARGLRVPPEPSWDRAIRRGGLMGSVMVIAFLFLFKSAPLGVRLAWGLFYAAAFIPLTYWIDRTAYRSYQRRLARREGKKA